MNKLGLGTVQFGCNYGISNINGQVSLSEVKKILDFAGENEINYIDTASLYGSSEEVLGKFDLSKFNVITKTVRMDSSVDFKTDLIRFKQAFLSSLVNLNCPQVYGLLFHECNDLLSNYGDTLWEWMSDIKTKGLASKIGVSVYNPEQLIQVLSKYDIDIVQLPLNIFDQRFVPLLAELKKKNIEIHSRSAFLQGLLLMDTDKVNDYFNKVKPLLNSIPEPKIAYALDFVKNIGEVDRIITGCTNLNELREIFMMYNKVIKKIDYSKYKVDDVNIINPSRWELK